MKVFYRPFLVAIASVVFSGAVSAADAPAKADSQMQTVLDALAKLTPKPIESLEPTIARAQPSAADAVIQAVQDKGDVAPDKLPPVGMVETKTVPGPNGAAIPVRVYTPKGDGPFPVLVYFHGGGWVIASLDTYDSSCRGLCVLNHAVVVSVDYRLAPEHKFPAAPEDCYAALQYVSEHAVDFKGIPGKIAVAGESAGGNLATVVCLMAEQRGGKMPVAQVLIYPVTNYAFDTESDIENQSAKPLNLPMMQWFFKHYLNSPGDGDNIMVSPFRASAEQLKALPPATVVTAEIDPLRSEGMAYADKLKAAGVDTESKTFPGVTHEFFGMALLVDQSKAANAFVVERLKAAFSR